MLVREAHEADLPAILAIYNEVIRNSTAIYALDEVALEEREAWFRTRRTSGYPVLVAESAGAVAGFASFGTWRGPSAGYRYSVEHSVHVRADVRGQGIGAALVGALIPYARRQAVHVMVGGIDASNHGSIRFHERLGFEAVAHFREVGRKFDRWLDLVFMQRLIDDPGAARPLISTGEPS